MAVPTFNSLHVYRYLHGLISQQQMLAMYPWENATTLAAAVVIVKSSKTTVAVGAPIPVH